MKVVEPKELSRAQIQLRLRAKHKELLDELQKEGVDINSPEFVRRFPRALTHEAASTILHNGGAPSYYAYTVQAAWLKEQSEENLGAPALVATPKGEN